MTIRCAWAPLKDPLYVAYHDQEWGVPIHDDTQIFEYLILEGFQAGLAGRPFYINAKISVEHLMGLTPRKSPGMMRAK